jgi:hypothetical protein
MPRRHGATRKRLIEKRRMAERGSGGRRRRAAAQDQAHEQGVRKAQAHERSEGWLTSGTEAERS